VGDIKKIICPSCKEEKNKEEDFYQIPGKKEKFSVCKNCINFQADTNIGATEVCRINNIYFDLNLYERAVVSAKKGNSKYYFGYYLRFLNMNRATYGDKAFKDSVFDIPESVVAFHETKKFAIRQSKYRCRRCGSEKPSSEYYATVDPLDTNDLCSICKSCIKEIFSEFYSDHQEIETAIYETCLKLNYGFHPIVIDKMLKEANELEPQEVVKNATEDLEIPLPQETRMIVDADDLFGQYLSTCNSLLPSNRAGLFDFYGPRPKGYEDYSTSFSLEDQLAQKKEEQSKSLVKKWGKGYEIEDIEQLESFFEEWEQKDLSNPSVSLLIRQLCMHQLDLERRRSKRDEITKKDYEILTMLMDKAGATPNKLNTDDSKSKQAWGTFIQKIETSTPAEYLDSRKKKYFDVNNIQQYFSALILRPMKNFVTGSRDFNAMIDDVSVSGIEQDSNGDSSG
jgi:hypothetical protein